MSARSIRSTRTTTSITADVLLLDTHVWIWTLAGDARRIGRRARSLLTRAESRDAIRISPVTLFEVMALHTIGRLQLTRPPDEWIRLAMTSAPVRIAELSPAIAIDAGRIPRDVLADPVDRLLVATALEMEATLLTADDRILQYGVGPERCARRTRAADASRSQSAAISRQAHGAANAGIAAGCRMMVAPAGHQMTEPGC